MKQVFAIFILCLLMIGCRGKNGMNGLDGLDGDDGTSGATQLYEGITPESVWGVQVDSFTSDDIVSVYYSIVSDHQILYEMRGPDSPITLTPYYELITSGSGVLVRLHNLPIGSLYRIVVYRSSSIS